MQVTDGYAWSSLALGPGYSIGVNYDNKLYKWGLTSFIDVNSTNPVQWGTDTNWKQVGCTDYTITAVLLKTTGTLWYSGQAWKDENNTTILPENLYTPAQIGSSTNWQSFSVNLASMMLLST